jgi:hypothetical protein
MNPARALPGADLKVQNAVLEIVCFLRVIHGRASGPAVRFQDLFLAFSPGGLAFGISYLSSSSSSSSKAELGFLFEALIP